jgi:predicted DNA-binding antitoxin AbrB/MazE fold protein
VSVSRLKEGIPMTERVLIDAIYERGALRPLEPLKLRERQRVQLEVIIEEVPIDAAQAEVERAAAVRILIEAGMLKSVGQTVVVADPVSSEERQRLADLMGCAPGKPLSEIVLEERGEW